ncbi:helix-turn-helix domain-containing protein [Streptomyces sp. NPDC053427]|uniref:AraC-like ligand-binding domain-containing protein n=1 Tax=Streptomyces sp. NPDC053427 TaxID=3365701 RepID=UPI0037D23020
MRVARWEAGAAVSPRTGVVVETVFDSAWLPADERAAAWRETTALALVTTKLKLVDPATFGARLRAMSLGLPQVTAMSYGPLVSRRTPAMIRQSDPEQYQIALVRSGSQAIEQVRNCARLGPGELVLYDSSRPFDAVVDAGCRSGSESLLLQFPKRLLPLPEAKVARLLAVPLSGTEGVGRLFAQFMATLAEEHVAYTPGDLARLGNTALDLATAVLAHHLDEEATAPLQSPQQVLFLRITSFIDRHLRAPDLGPAAVASAHGLSLRSLHRLFQQHNTSVGAYIKGRRVDRCRRDLADPGLQHLTVHAIAARWGFPRPADFSRAFRGVVGMSPSAYRALTRSAVAAQGPDSWTRPPAPTGRMP